MKKRHLLLLLPILLITMAMKQDKPAYKLFNSNGKEVKYKKLLKASAEADIVFFGELHNNPICHWLQIELTEDLYEKTDGKLVLGAEMIEADDQDSLNLYLSGEIEEDVFKKNTRVWKNYKTDYKPLVEFAKENNLNFVASNVPRRYASQVNKKGLESLEQLDENNKKYIAPLPIKYDPELRGYKEMIEMMKGMGHSSENFPKAQAIKDATMAHFILKNLDSGQTFIHYNGSYHSKNFEGIMWYIQQERPDLKIITIASEEQDDINKLDEDFKDLADFILVMPSKMTKTY